MVDVHGVVEEEFGQSVLEQVDARQIRLKLGDKHIYALGILRREVVGPPVTSPYERKTVPVQAVSRGAVFYVRAPPVAYRYAILVVTDSVFVLPVELVNFDLVAVSDR